MAQIPERHRDSVFELDVKRVGDFLQYYLAFPLFIFEGKGAGRAAAAMLRSTFKFNSGRLYELRARYVDSAMAIREASRDADVREELLSIRSLVLADVDAVDPMYHLLLSSILRQRVVGKYRTILTCKSTMHFLSTVNGLSDEFQSIAMQCPRENV